MVSSGLRVVCEWSESESESGTEPTRFRKKERFEWGGTHSFLKKLVLRVGRNPLVFYKSPESSG